MNPNWLIGKTIASVDMNTDSDGRGGKYHRPRIVFTDGSRITFTTRETDVGEYGTEINYHKASP